MAMLVAIAAPVRAQLPGVRVTTSLGVIVVVIDTVRAPVTSANFLRYVDAGMYSGGRFHRTGEGSPPWAR